jgi:hypothetical protein
LLSKSSTLRQTFARSCVSGNAAIDSAGVLIQVRCCHPWRIQRLVKIRSPPIVSNEFVLDVCDGVMTLEPQIR